MFKHNFLIILRSFKRFKSTFLINLIGLSTGLACAILIYLWVDNELSIDKFHENDSRLYQVMENQMLADGIETQDATPDLLAETLADEMPEIEYAAAVTPTIWFSSFNVSADDKKLKAVGQFAGEDYFKIFTFNFKEGDKNKVLSDNNSIVISEELALKLFGTTQNVIGKTIEWELLQFKKPSFVSGIIKRPENSTAQFDFVLTFEAFKDLSKEINRTLSWGNHGPNTFVTLKEGTDAAKFNKKIKGFIKSKFQYSIVYLFITPYSDRYLHGKYENGKQAGGRIEYVNLFSIIAAFILFIACINFMNLSTAKASARAKEVGIKKAIGASRRNLIIQYLYESIFMSALSLFVSLILVELFLPQFNLITGKELSFSYSLSFLLPAAAITLLTGIISGSYPALYLSGFNPVTILKGKINKGVGEVFARKGLVIFQFALSTILIVSVLVVYNQIDFIQSKNLGYNKDNIIHFEKDGKIAKDENAFLTEMRKIPGVLNASSTGSNLAGTTSSTEGINWEGKNPDELIRFENIAVNFDMIETFGMKVLQGRSFSKEFSDEDSKIIFNEAAVKIMGMKDPVGKTVNLWGSDKQIIGIVRDFHFESMHENIKPLFFILRPDRTLKIAARIAAGRERETINTIKTLYADFNPGNPFDYKFLDQDYQVQYEAETRVSLLSRYFAGLAILISCLGLFGLAAFTAERRLKEIGIRKVLGSGHWGIVYLLSSDFTKIVFISTTIALPLSYLLTKNWLTGFAYRINLEWWFFAAAGFAALLIAWITVGIQAVKTANINPVQCLKDE